MAFHCSRWSELLGDLAAAFLEGAVVSPAAGLRHPNRHRGNGRRF